MKLLYKLFFIFLFLISNLTYAEVVNDIKIKGLQRVEPGVIFDSIPFDIGDDVNDIDPSEIIKYIYKSGQFRDVSVEFDSGNLTVVVSEKPIIASIEFNGNQLIQEDKLREGIRQVNLYEGAVFDKQVLSNLEKDLSKSYNSMGRYNISVKASFRPLERNRVAIKVDIDEGTLTRISRISINGLTKFSEEDLLEVIGLKATNILSWWEKDDRYSKSELTADLEKIKSFYLDKGYLKFKILSTDVSITPNKKKLAITIDVEEGEKYTFGDISISGDINEFSDADIKSNIAIKKGDFFSSKLVNKSSDNLSKYLGNFGYAFANINPISNIDEQNKSVSYDFFVDTGNKIYVRNINFIGNTRTKDRVLRREMRQFESSWYDESKVARSKFRLTRLQYFSAVDVDTAVVPGNTDQVDLNVNVTERNTGKIMLGAGVSSAEGLMGSFNVSQRNFAGSGNTVALGVSTGRINRTYSLSYTDPYYTDDGVSRGFQVYRRDRNTAKLRGIGTYNTYSYGGGVNFGIPLSEKDFLNLGVTLDFTELELTDRSPALYKDYCNKASSSGAVDCTANSIAFDVGIVTDTRDNVLIPTEGMMTKYTATVTAPVLDMQYYKLQAQTEFYKPLDDAKKFTLKLRGGLGYADDYGSEDYPFFKNFYMGGPRTVRGYRTSSIGPKYYNSTAKRWYTTGGTTSILASAELYFPVPGLKKNDSFRLSAFFDAGGVFSDNESIDGTEQYEQGEMRYSMGFGVQWNSPFGPLQVSIAEPLNDDNKDRTQRFQFGMGSTF
ncbi:outer membrane protein assembly complex, YaeT protein [beta proteobacterium KB13]|uniref:Outer membrane protein assembly factor BamA n=1 Tax=beta proteobacterium KB13 TaxID=314607 RepID=B6BTV6_9PROT|nr:outer membrane protein assembly complex, YaeT protein [beta proteobacterium KB13]